MLTIANSIQNSATSLSLSSEAFPLRKEKVELSVYKWHYIAYRLHTYKKITVRVHEFSKVMDTK